MGTAVAADDAITTTRPVLALTMDGKVLSDEVWLYRQARRADPSIDAFFRTARSAAHGRA